MPCINTISDNALLHFSCFLCFFFFTFLHYTPIEYYYYSLWDRMVKHFCCVSCRQCLPFIKISVYFYLSDGPICRICHEGGSSEGLLSPCDCTGTLGTVHKSCLEKWLSSSNTSYCELCHTEFSIERRPRPLTEVTKVNALCLVCNNPSSHPFYSSWLGCWL